MRFLFDAFELDLDRRALLGEGAPLRLSPKAFTLLDLLVRNAPRAMSKEELTEALWPQTFVEEGNLAGLVAELRAALGDRRGDPRYIRTIHGFGYAFCAEVTKQDSRKRAAAAVFDGEELPLYEGVNVLGRDASAGVVIDDATVSRRHASIRIGPEGAVLEDLDSKNGTFVEGERLTGPSMLEDGSTFVLGDARVTFRDSTGARSTVTIVKHRGEE